MSEMGFECFCRNYYTRLDQLEAVGQVSPRRRPATRLLQRVIHENAEECVERCWGPAGGKDPTISAQLLGNGAHDAATILQELASRLENLRNIQCFSDR